MTSLKIKELSGLGRLIYFNKRCSLWFRKYQVDSCIIAEAVLSTSIRWVNIFQQKLFFDHDKSLIAQERARKRAENSFFTHILEGNKRLIIMITITAKPSFLFHSKGVAVQKHPWLICQDSMLIDVLIVNPNWWDKIILRANTKNHIRTTIFSKNWVNYSWAHRSFSIIINSPTTSSRCMNGMTSFSTEYSSEAAATSGGAYWTLKNELKFKHIEGDLILFLL